MKKIKFEERTIEEPMIKTLHELGQSLLQNHEYFLYSSYALGTGLASLVTSEIWDTEEILHGIKLIKPLGYSIVLGSIPPLLMSLGHYFTKTYNFLIDFKELNSDLHNTQIKTRIKVPRYE